MISRTGSVMDSIRAAKNMFLFKSMVSLLSAFFSSLEIWLSSNIRVSILLAIGLLLLIGGVSA